MHLVICRKMGKSLNQTKIQVAILIRSLGLTCHTCGKPKFSPMEHLIFTIFVKVVGGLLSTESWRILIHFIIFLGHSRISRI